MGILSATEKVNMMIQAESQDLKGFLTSKKGAKPTMQEMLIIFDIPITRHSLFTRNYREEEILDYAAYLSRQFNKREMIQETSKIEAVLEELEEIKQEFLDEVEAAEAREARKKELQGQMKEKKQQIKPFAAKLLLEINSFLDLAQEAGLRTQHDHLTNFKDELIRYELLSKDEAKDPEQLLEQENTPQESLFQDQEI